MAQNYDKCQSREKGLKMSAVTENGIHMHIFKSYDNKLPNFESIKDIAGFIYAKS